jgi:anti-sigma B factor antagonist
VEINKKIIEGKTVLFLTGRLDSNTSPELEKTILPVLKECEGVLILDFNEVDYISSAGLRVLLLAAKIIGKSDGNLIICGMKEFIKEVFNIAGFTAIFNIVGTLEEALK